MSRKMTLAMIGAGVVVAAGIAVGAPALAQGVATGAAGQVETAAGYRYGAQDDSSTDWRGAGRRAADEQRGTGAHGQQGVGNTDSGFGHAAGTGAEGGDGQCEACSAEPGSGDLAALGEDGIADLVTWIEEEKVAFDLYTAFGEMYDASQFERIAASEANHMEAVRGLLATYGLDDPTVGALAGEFDNPDLQALYDTLYAQGSRSQTDALAVGVAVEKDDIALIEQALGDVTAADVTEVLNQQLSASQRHLAAFSR